MLQRMRGGLIAWFVLVSYPMQQEAARRAQLLHAHIWAAKQGVPAYDIEDDAKKKVIRVVERPDGRQRWQASYKLSRLRIGLSNFMRKFSYAYYGGAGEHFRNLTPERMRYYYVARYDRSLEELPDLGFSPSGSPIRDSLPYRYVAALVKMATALLRR